MGAISLVKKSEIIVGPIDGMAGINEAVAKLNDSGLNGIVRLLPGTHTLTGAGVDWPSEASGIVIAGCGKATIVDSQVTGNGYAFNIEGALGAERDEQACSNVSAGDTTVTVTTHANAAFFTSQMWVKLVGLDSDGCRRQLMMRCASTGNGSTGVVTLKTPISVTLTSVQLTGFLHGLYNGIRDFKVIHSAGESHVLRYIDQLFPFMENIYMDGEGFSESYCVELNNANFTKIKNCHGVDYNQVENYAMTDSCVGMTILDCANLDIENLTLDNCGVPHGTVASQTSLVLNDLDTARFKNVNILNSQNRGIVFTAGGGASYHDVRFDNLKVDRSTGMQFLIPTSCKVKNLVVNDSKITNGVVEGVLIQSGTRGVSFKSTDFIDNGQDSLSIQDIANDVSVDDCSFTGSPFGLVLYKCKNFSVNANRAFGNNYGLYIWQSEKGSVTGNSTCDNQRGLKSEGAGDHVTYTGNTSKGNSNTNFALGNTDTNQVVVGNDFEDTLVSYGTGSGHLIANNKDGTTQLGTASKPGYISNNSDSSQVLVPAGVNNPAKVKIGNLVYTNTSQATMDLDTAGRGGLDTGSKAADTVYYLYAIPATSGFTFDLVCSITDPSTGPTGFTNWSYLGAFATVAASAIPEFTANKGFFECQINFVTTSTTNATSPTSKSLTHVPVTAKKYWGAVTVGGTGLGAYGIVTGSSTANTEAMYAQLSVISQNFRAWGFVPAFTPGTIWLYVSNGSNTASWSHNGWVEDPNEWK